MFYPLSLTNCTFLTDVEEGTNKQGDGNIGSSEGWQTRHDILYCTMASSTVRRVWGSEKRYVSSDPLL